MKSSTEKTEIINKILEEYKRAIKKFKKFNSPHEGIAVIREEYLELEEMVFWDKNKHLLEQEAVQLAAMSIRFLTDCCACTLPELKKNK